MDCLYCTVLYCTVAVYKVDLCQVFTLTITLTLYINRNGLSLLHCTAQVCKLNLCQVFTLTRTLITLYTKQVRYKWIMLHIFICIFTCNLSPPVVILSDTAMEFDPSCAWILLLTVLTSLKMFSRGEIKIIDVIVFITFFIL